MKLTAPIYRLKHQAKQIARQLQIPLHKALDQLARQEGFHSWSHLSFNFKTNYPARSIFAKLTSGDMLLLGARPGHGKTLLGLELSVIAAQKGYQAYFFTLEYNLQDVLTHLQALQVDYQSLESNFVVETSDGICADYIGRTVAHSGSRPFIVIDYLQLLDQRRTHPHLIDQLQDLKALAARSGAVILLISQIDRRFEDGNKSIPTLEDVRMPNPVDLSVFTLSCFLHNGNIKVDRLRAA